MVVGQTRDSQVGKKGSCVLIADKGRDTKDKGQQDVGSFLTDSMQCQELITQLVTVLGHDPLVIETVLAEPSKDRLHCPGLIAVKTGRAR